MDLKFDSQTVEKIICIYLLRTPNFLLKVGKYLITKDYKKRSFFIDDKLQFLLNIAVAYQKQYNKAPSKDIFVIYVEKKFSEDPLIKKSLMALIEDIFSKDISSIDTKFIEEQTVNFIKKQRAVEATLLNQADIISGNYDSLDERMREAVNINLDKDFGYSIVDMDTTFRMVQQAQQDTGLSYGSMLLDKSIGTPQPGELSIWCGTPGIGKSIWLANAAVKNFELGKKVVIFSMEMDERRFSSRIYQSLFSRSGVELVNMNIDDAKLAMSTFNPNGDVRIKRYPANAASCSTFEAYLNDLKATTGFEPDIIIIDYILITATNDKKSTSSENSYGYYKTVSEEMRNLGATFKVPILSASQINREGMNQKGGSNGVVTSRDLSQSRGILDTVDNLFIIQQTASEKEAAEKTGKGKQRLRLDKIRNGSTVSNLVYTVDYKTMSVIEGEDK